MATHLQHVPFRSGATLRSPEPVAPQAPPRSSPAQTPTLERPPAPTQETQELVIRLAEAPRGYLVVKRALDLLLTAGALGVLSPVLMLIALLIKLEDGGPVLYSQSRVGEGGRRFLCFKFRSMRPDADALRAGLKASWSLLQEGRESVRFKLAEDPRVTRIGGLLRRFSLDELPQLLNVIRGDMSLVGPRPPIPEEVAEYGPLELRRLSVPQGLTCIWQVSGRSLIPFPEQVELDLEYARKRSLGLDLWLMVRTVPAVLGGRGAC